MQRQKETQLDRQTHKQTERKGEGDKLQNLISARMYGRLDTQIDRQTRDRNGTIKRNKKK